MAARLACCAVAALAAAAVSVGPASAADVHDAHRAGKVAHSVYPAGPVPSWRVGGMDPRNAGAAAEADFRGCQVPGPSAFGAGRCEVRFDPVAFDTASFAQLCSYYVHEEAHLDGWWVPGYPDDGVHSPDPTSNMHGGKGRHHPACGPSDERRRKLENRLGSVRDYAASLRELRSESRSAKRRQRINRRLLRMRALVARYRHELNAPHL